EQWLKKVDDEWAKDKVQKEQRFAHIKQAFEQEKGQAQPQWYVNSQGQTMVVLPGPAEFMMGSPSTEIDRNPDESLHRRRIARSFAIASKPVTNEQFLRFHPRLSNNSLHKKSNDPTCPIESVTWYEAAAYCNWLSEQEDIPKDQWCYETNPQGHVVGLKENY